MKIKILPPSNTHLLCRIEYNMNVRIPTKWNDLSPFQVRAIGRFMFNNRDQRLDSTFIKKVMISILLVPRPTLRNILKSCIVLLDIPFSELEQYTGFIFDEKQHMSVFPEALKVGRWPFRKKLYGPAARLANVTVEELSYADAYFYKWQTERNVDDLDRLVAILYRPGRKSGPNPIDARVDFHALKLERNAQLTDKIPRHIKFMVAHAYYGCRQIFISRHPHVFPVKKQPEGEQPKNQKPKPYQPFSKIIDAFAMDEVQIFGPHQNVEKILAPKFLSVYEESIKREQEKERQRNLKK